MKAIYLERKGGAESLVSGEIQQPHPEENQVLDKVHATAIKPTEGQWTPTFQTPYGAARPFPIVLGHEFSGVIESVGGGVREFSFGEEVYGLNDWHINGAQAEYCVVSASAVAR